MAYIEIDQYLRLGGNLMDESAFNRLSYRAEKLIDRYTQSRVRKMKGVPESVQRCMVELINIMGASDPSELATKPVLSSFNNDGYSETYAAPVTVDSVTARMVGTILDYLTEQKDDEGTPLLYLGVS